MQLFVISDLHIEEDDDNSSNDVKFAEHTTLWGEDKKVLVVAGDISNFMNHSIDDAVICRSNIQ